MRAFMNHIALYQTMCIFSRVSQHVVTAKNKGYLHMLKYAKPFTSLSNLTISGFEF